MPSARREAGIRSADMAEAEVEEPLKPTPWRNRRPTMTGSRTVSANSGESTAMIATPIRYTPCRLHRSDRLPHAIRGSRDPRVYAATIRPPAARSPAPISSTNRGSVGVSMNVDMYMNTALTSSRTN